MVDYDQMKNSPLNVVILAAGAGERMRSELPKVLQPLAGKAMLAHVLDTARSLGAQNICVVVGHGGDAVRVAFPATDIQWANQSPQLGTGHALNHPRGDAILAAGVLFRDPVQEDGAGVVIMGCAGMARYRRRLEDAVGATVVDPTQAAVTMALGAVLLAA